MKGLNSTVWYQSSILDSVGLEYHAEVRAWKAGRKQLCQPYQEAELCQQYLAEQSKRPRQHSPGIVSQLHNRATKIPQLWLVDHQRHAEHLQIHYSCRQKRFLHRTLRTSRHGENKTFLNSIFYPWRHPLLIQQRDKARRSYHIKKIKMKFLKCRW
jgi:hypothetical protein